MKKVLSLILTLMLVVSTAAYVGAAGFPDVDDNYAWAEEAIASLSENKIITGYEDGTFKPGKSITRQEAITLFSRALGASEASNESIVNLAYGIYEADLTASAGSYAVKPGAYMIYRKVLTATEVNDFLSKNNRDVELKRYEAASLIAKALGADAWLKTNPEIEVTFTDKNAIPAAALPYVYYATELGIMNGMGDNKFGPKETVTRAQIAVMIQRILDTMEFEYVHGMISGVDTFMNNMTVKTDDGEVITVGVSNSSVVYVDGTKASLVELSAGMECALIFSKDSLYQVDAITYVGDEVVTGMFRGMTSVGGSVSVSIADLDKEDNPATSYKLASNVVVEVNGVDGKVSDIKAGDYVELKMSEGLGVSLIAEGKTTTISNATLKYIDTSSNVVLTVTTKEGYEYDYTLADVATVTRNGKAATFSDLAIGDTVELVLEYRKVVKVRAIGTEKSIEGTISEITISNATSYISITKTGTTYKYPISKNCTIVLDGASASIYDLRLGAYVKLTASSDTITKVESEAVAQALSLTGTIKNINAAYGLVIISYQNEFGEMVDKQLFIKDNAKILNTENGKLVTIKALNVGNIITAAGVEKLGVYEVSSLMILQ